jgi:hypothetical protein
MQIMTSKFQQKELYHYNNILHRDLLKNGDDK